MEIIKVPNLSKTKHDYDPWMNAKVISPTGNYRLVGWSADVEDYIHKNKITGFIILSFIMNKESRGTRQGMFRNGKKVNLYFIEPSHPKPWRQKDKKKLHDSRRWRVTSFKGYQKDYFLRRLPSYWCPLYESLSQL